MSNYILGAIVALAGVLTGAICVFVGWLAGIEVRRDGK